ncbi:SCO7613 C-terminal domain-containing membrane protein [Pseudogracilibacillus auburnensis]|uniref:SCO7613 C-terminal domain-containing membrane protein n=1 Tax=Pseudogracilibacillus auburnensis TaxID=1494959 RepID=UPI0035585D84
MPDEKRKQIMKEELDTLYKKKYIQENVYHYVLRAHKRYYDDLHRSVQSEKTHTVTSSSQVKHEQKKVTPQKKKLSAQEIRERNITWSLSIGVIFLLIAGTFLATSTWDILSNWMKTGMIAFVSIMFFGLAIFTERMLKIKKTAFSFHVLGSLFLPIIILSIGFFGQLGSYLSFDGEGRFLLGALGSLIILPIYLMLAIKLQARLFVWFTYVIMTFLVGFLLAWFDLPIDGFYLSMMMYNSALILIYKFMNNRSRFTFFTKELLLFLQANVILSTLLLPVFYSNEFVHGFNLILTAFIYLAMIYVTKNKHYHFVFTVMLVYGAYQMIEFSSMSEVGPIAYALLGFIFLALPKFGEDKHSLAKTFNYTSAFISGCAFLFMTIQGFFIRADQPSIVLFIAYVLIALNFIYLSNKTKKAFIHYLGPIFLSMALFEAIRIGQTIFGYDSLVLPMFFAAFVLYVLFGCLIKVPFFQPIKSSSRDMAALIMILCLLLEWMINHWWQVGIMFLFISLTALLMIRFEKRVIIVETATWIHPITLGFAVSMFYMEIQEKQFLYHSLGSLEPVGFIIASLVVLVASVGWRFLKKQRLYHHAFFVSQGFYLFGMFATFHLLHYDFNPVVRATVFFGGIVMAYLLYRKTKWIFTPYIVSSVTLIFYLTALYAIHWNVTITSELFHSLQLSVGALLLLVIGNSIKIYDIVLAKAFWWVGHFYLPMALLSSMLVYEEMNFWATLLATIIYGYSLFKVTTEWKVKTFLYACSTSFWLALTYLFYLIDWNGYAHYAWLITSIALTATSFWGASVWRKRISFYVIPFSMIGLFIFILVNPFNLQAFGVTIFYAVLLLAFIRLINWDLFTCIPITFTFIAVVKFTFSYPEMEYIFIFIFAILLFITGYILYPSLYPAVKNKLPIIDWYTIFGFFALFSLYGFAGDALWENALPGLFISAGTLLQRKRIPSITSKWVLFFAIVYLLEPYYTVLNDIQVSELIRVELYVLPWIGLTILLKRFASKQQRMIVNYIQWAVLLVTSLILVQDAYQSGTIYDALILGTLALVSLLCGMMFKLKSFFLIGTGVLLLNVLLQTRPLWGSMPWWAYLLIAGTILIVVASYNEWHKQKTSEGKETIISLFNKKVIQRMKKWD